MRSANGPAPQSDRYQPVSGACPGCAGQADGATGNLQKRAGGSKGGRGRQRCPWGPDSRGSAPAQGTSACIVGTGGGNGSGGRQGSAGGPRSAQPTTNSCLRASVGTEGEHENGRDAQAQPDQAPALWLRQRTAPPERTGWKVWQGQCHHRSRRRAQPVPEDLYRGGRGKRKKMTGAKK